MPEIVTCKDFPEAPPCCACCHNDEEVGYPLLDSETPDGKIALLCCVVRGWAEKRDMVR